MKISKQKIQQLFQLKPTRAVDIVLSENKIDQVHQFYSSLQENKKNNTFALKKTLENNYEKMLYCSQLLDQVKKYGQAVRQVATQIQGQISNSQNAVKDKENNSFNQVDRIESLIRQYKFSQAMKSCNQSPNQQKLSSSDKYYISYLKIEIINKMDRHICTNMLTERTIQEYSKCLQLFIFVKNQEQLRVSQGLQKWLRDYNQKSIVGLIGKRINLFQQIKNQSKVKSSILQILFEYKLRTVRNKYKHLSTPSYFQHFFQQMAMIIRLYKAIKLETSKNLRKIFKECTAQIKSQLASIFIQKLGTGEIVFKSQLYDQLISSPLFEANIQKFHDEISQNGTQQVEHPAKFIKELWHDYFINLIDVFLSQVNPLIRLPSLKQHSVIHDNLPKQLQLYLHDYSLEQSLHIISEYHEKIQLLLKNIVPIIKKCSHEELGSFKIKFDSKVKQISGKCAEYIRKLEDQKTVLAFRKYILLRILSGMLQREIAQINNKNSINLQVNQMVNIHKETKLSLFWTNFLFEKQEYTLIDSFLQFDAFFIGYLQGVPVPFKAIIIQSISEIAMKLLSCVEEQIKGRQKQLLSYTLDSIKQKKEKVTILQSIVVPYLAQKIFKIQMKEVKIQKSLFEKRFICKIKPIIPVKIQENFSNQFQIGQKEQKEQFVKVNNIGKSIVHMGTSLLTGFIKKK